MMKSSSKQDKWNNLNLVWLLIIFYRDPILNLVIMPVAICGATAMWCDRYRKQHAARWKAVA